MIHFTVSKNATLAHAWVRNVLSAEGQIPFSTMMIDVEFSFHAESLSDSDDVAPHEYLTVYAGQVLELFDGVHILWDKDERAQVVTAEIHEYYGGVRSLSTPYNPTLEHVSGMIYAVMHRILCASNFTNSEDPELELVCVKVSDRVTNTTVTYDSLAFEGRLALNATTFRWSSSVLETAALDVVSLFSEDVRIDVPVAEKTVDKYE